MIQFNLFPIDFRVPGVYIEHDNSRMFRGLSGMPARVLLVGQKVAAGTAAPLVPLRITNTDEAKARFGAGSQLAHMVESFRKQELMVEMWAIAQEDAGAGVAASGSLVFSGAVTAPGIVYLYIGGRRVQVGIVAAQTMASIATAVTAAINANFDLAVSAAVDGVNTAKVNLTAKNDGTAGNSVDIRLNYQDDEALPAGLAVAITAMSAGAGNPDITDVFAAIGDEWFTDFVVPYTDATNLGAVKTFLNSRFGPLVMQDGHAYIGATGSHATLCTAGETHNSPHLTMIGYKSSPTPPYEWAAAMGAACSFYGKQDPARPFRTIPLVGVLPPKITDRFTLEERNLQLFSGITTFNVDADGIVRLERVITTYRETPNGAADPSYLDLTTLKTIAYLRYDLRNHLSLMYPRYKLADDGTNFSRGQNVVTPNIIRATIIARFAQWEAAGLVENVEQFKRDLIVERNANDPNRLDALIPPDLVNQLNIFAGLLQPRL